MNFLNGLLDNIYSALTWVIELLPDSPFQAIDNSGISDFLGTLNWFIPIDMIIAELELWLSCVVVYYVYQIILRWAKAIE